MYLHTILPSLVMMVMLTVVGSGCTFSRITTNDHVKSLDAQWVQPGKTTRAEVIRRLGMPPPIGETHNITQAIAPGTLHYVASDTRQRTLGLGYILTLDFVVSETNEANDLLFLFDENDVVRRISRTHRDGEEVTLLDYREVTP